MVTIENKGPGTIPEQVWVTEEEPECSLTILLNEEEFSKTTVLEFDPDKALQPVEGIAVFPTDLKITEEATVAAVIDCAHLINEQNEENNSLTAVLECEK